jgi:sulfoxide reductase heme-binding subunit YedZ
MSEALWYLGRGTGLVSLVLLTIVVALGIAGRSGRPLPGLPRFAVTLVHRNAALLAVSLLAVHVTTLLFDPYAQLTAVDLVLPFLGSYEPFWLGLGTLAMDVLIALVATSLLRHRIGARAWRAVHWLAYLCWPIAVLHGVGTGTDAGTLWLRLSVGACVTVVVAAVGWRLTGTFLEYAFVRAPADRVPRSPARPPVRSDGHR